MSCGIGWLSKNYAVLQKMRNFFPKMPVITLILLEMILIIEIGTFASKDWTFCSSSKCRMTKHKIEPILSRMTSSFFIKWWQLEPNSWKSLSNTISYDDASCAEIERQKNMQPDGKRLKNMHTHIETHICRLIIIDTQIFGRLEFFENSRCTKCVRRQIIHKSHRRNEWHFRRLHTQMHKILANRGTTEEQTPVRWRNAELTADRERIDAP